MPNTIGLAHLTSSEFDWQSLGDLGPYHIGAVTSYAYEEEFDQMMFSQGFEHSFYPDNVALMNALVEQQVDAAAISRESYRYLVSYHPLFKDKIEQLKFHEKRLAQRPLHVGFKRDNEHETMRIKFNNAITKIDLRLVQQKILAVAWHYQ